MIGSLHNKPILTIIATIKAHKSSQQATMGFFCIFVISIFLLCVANPLHSQELQTSQIVKKAASKRVIKEDSIVPFKSRWGIRTNAVDWALVIPNVAVEYDVSSSIYNRVTVGLATKWNWNTTQTYKPSMVYNLFDIRAEGRYYWRTDRTNVNRPDSVKIGVKDWLKETFFTRYRKNPRFWRSYFVGGYVAANSFSLKFGEKGIQGSSYGIGITGGFSVPLYSYKNNFIDIEFGASAGLMYAKYDVFRSDRESNCYPRIAAECKAGHIVPFPVINDVRVAFVYRFTSIKDKYKRVDREKITARDNARIARRQAKEAKQFSKDSIQNVKLKVKEMEKLRKDSVKTAERVADSLEAVANKLAKETKVLPLVNSDSLALPKDSIAQPKDSIAQPTDSIAQPKDSIAQPTDSIAQPIDSIAQPTDSIAQPKAVELTPDDLIIRPEDLLPIGEEPKKEAPKAEEPKAVESVTTEKTKE